MDDFYDLVDGDALGAAQNQEVVHHSAPPAPPESEGPFVDDDGRERRWQERKPLKTDGQLSRQNMLKLMDGLVDMYMSDETARLLKEKIAANENMQEVMKQWQHDYMEGEGFEKSFVITQWQAVGQNFGQDKRVLTALKRCQLAAMIAMQQTAVQEIQLAPAEERRLKPADEVQKTGPLTREQLLNYIQQCCQMLMSPGTLKLFNTAHKEGKVGTMHDTPHTPLSSHKEPHSPPLRPSLFYRTSRRFRRCQSPTSTRCSSTSALTRRSG
jgi:hypothetical protein